MTKSDAQIVLEGIDNTIMQAHTDIIAGWHCIPAGEWQHLESAFKAAQRLVDASVLIGTNTDELNKLPTNNPERDGKIADATQA